MATFPPGFFGPHPKYAAVPVLLVLGLLGWIAANNPVAVAAPGAVAVVAMKPIEGAAAAPGDAGLAAMKLAPGELPVEVLYGVPSARTMHLWSPAGQPLVD